MNYFKKSAAVTSVVAALLIALLCAGCTKTPEKGPDGGTAAGTQADNNERPLFVFNVIGDMQLGYEKSYCEENYTKALQSIAEISPESALVLSTGDNTQHSRDDEYALLVNKKKEILGDLPMYLAIGNHDRGYVEGYGAGNADFDEIKGRFVENARITSGKGDIDEVYYSFEAGGYRFIILGSEAVSRNDTCNDVYISDAQYNWFVSEMRSAAGTGGPVFVVIHEPYYNTVSGTLPGQNWNGNPAGDGFYEDNKYEALKEVIDGYPQAVVFSGHTHWEFKSKSPVSFGDGDHATYINASSVGYLWNDKNEGYLLNNKYSGSEGMFVYVYSDKIIIKGRDFINNSWILEESIPIR